MAIGSIQVQKLHAIVGYVDLSADILLEYDSKNKVFVHTCGTSEALAMTLNKGILDPADTVSLAEAPVIGSEKIFSESISESDSNAKTININLAEIVGSLDIHPLEFQGLINGAMFNERDLHGGDAVTNVTDITITVV